MRKHRSKSQSSVHLKFFDDAEFSQGSTVFLLFSRLFAIFVTEFFAQISLGADVQGKRCREFQSRSSLPRHVRVSISINAKCSGMNDKVCIRVHFEGSRGYYSLIAILRGRIIVIGMVNWRISIYYCLENVKVRKILLYTIR